MLYLSKLRSYWVSILPMTGASIQQQKSASYKTVNTPGLVVSMRELRVNQGDEEESYICGRFRRVPT